jgi:hypothetical protein
MALLPWIIQGNLFRDPMVILGTHLFITSIHIETILYVEECAA